VIEAAVRSQFKETDGIVAVITFCGRRHVELGFTDGRNAVMALAAITKNFLVISKGDNSSALRCMAGLAQITGGDVIGRFARIN
jgi:hypothetical protein